MKLFYGSYPHLENAFADFVSSTRRSILEKWLIICSSSLVAQELQTKLARQTGALANIHFVTLSGLISRLDSENNTSSLPLFPQDHLRSFLIKELLRRPGLDRYPVTDGFVETVKNSLRDMADSMLPADAFEEHINSLPDRVLQEEGDRLFWLSHLYRTYSAEEQKIPGFRSYQQSFENALSQVEKSSYLHGFKHLILYGFYDMSGRQLELVHFLRQTYPLTVFAPYQKHPAFEFAKKFFETNWLVTSDITCVDVPPQTPLQKSVNCLFSPGESIPCQDVRFVSAPDVEGEVFFAAKEILRLTEQSGYHFEDIGIIARTSVPYQEALRRVFAENKIPLNGAFTYPLSHYALGRFCINLLALALGGFEREAVLKLVSSPYFKGTSKASWAALIRRSLVSRDLHQWQDLLPQTKGYDASFLAWLETLSSQLNALSAPQPWQNGVDKALALLKSTVDESAFAGKDREIFEAICAAIEKIGLFALLRAQSREGELMQEVQQALKQLIFHEAQQTACGVMFTDAVRARGLQFKIVFILGLNDRTFPLVTPEDPVLRDFYRYMLRDILGYWINQSLTRSQEEKLLFFMAANSAQEKLYVLRNRFDEEGKPAVMSVYWAEFLRAARIFKDSPCLVHVSGHIKAQLAQIPGELLTPKELSYLIALHPVHASAYYQAAGLLSADKQIALTAALAMGQTGPLSSYDGILASGADFFARVNQKGFSPSALQELASCPLKYFFHKGLQLGEPEELLDRSQLPANEKGTLYHEVLKEFYEYLYQHHLTHDLFDSGAEACLARVLAKHYPPEGYRTFGIYPLVWEMLVENMRAKLTEFVVEDLKQLGTFTPSRFELPVELAPTEELPVRLQGIIDRIDLDETTHSFLIADYKSTRKGTKDLASDLFTQLVFQPFLYSFIALHLPQLQGYQPAGACLLSIHPKYDRRTLSAQAFEKIRLRAVQFFKQITGLISQGMLVMYPSVHCQFCPYSALCRRDSFKALLRARKSEVYQALEEARL